MRNPSDIDLNLLVIFHELFQQRQVSLVAERLGLSQPTISNALARLRKTFDDELFVRTAQGMQPTPYAQDIAEPITNALANVSRALNRQQQFEPLSSDRQFVIAMTDVGEIHFMPTLLEQCNKIAPHVRISAVRVNTVDWREGIETGQIDLVIGAFTDASESLYHRSLFSQKYVTMFRKDHVFANGKVSLAEFLQARHLIVSSRENPYDVINDRLEKAGVASRAQFHVPHFTSVPYIVSSTDMVVTVPEKLAQRAAAPFGLAFIYPPLKLPPLQTSIFWHRRFNQDSGNQWLRTVIAKTFRE
ncbi:LysR family transcriptional regulator [Noviherbaspirillum saxi]|uniref:LysR family transcriptional regulator n=1 Tax=Noviherbaspirillum saxi TaxID=2320863 RepID=A0A3A3FG15_9BURK|nr:LysR family transcriptional regulator [Noviherbaspirillum saxi]RJF92027.1 LysR family transcriptional regulator [Noviherbaspirillum saxi]